MARDPRAYVCMCVYIYIYVCVCIYIYIYIYVTLIYASIVNIIVAITRVTVVPIHIACDYS